MAHVQRRQRGDGPSGHDLSLVWWSTNASTGTASPSFSACSRPAIPGARCARHGTQGDHPLDLRHHYPKIARLFVIEPTGDVQDESFPPEVHSLGRTLPLARDPLATVTPRSKRKSKRTTWALLLLAW